MQCLDNEWVSVPCKGRLENALIATTLSERAEALRLTTNDGYVDVVVICGIPLEYRLFCMVIMLVNATMYDCGKDIEKEIEIFWKKIGFDPAEKYDLAHRTYRYMFIKETFNKIIGNPVPNFKFFILGPKVEEKPNQLNSIMEELIGQLKELTGQ